MMAAAVVVCTVLGKIKLANTATWEWLRELMGTEGGRVWFLVFILLFVFVFLKGVAHTP